MVRSSILSTLLQLYFMRDSSITLELLRFIKNALSNGTIRHALLLSNLVGILESVTNLYPRHADIAFEVQGILSSLINEELIGLYLMKKNIMAIFTTTFLAQSSFPRVLATTVRTLARLCSVSRCPYGSLSPVALIVNELTNEQVLSDAVSTTKNHPFNADLWNAVMDLLESLQQTSRGVKFLSTRPIVSSIHSCISYLPKNTELITRARALLDHKGATSPVEEQAVITPIAPVHGVPVLNVRRRGSNDEAVQTTYRLERLPTEGFWLSLQGPEGVDFLSLLLYGLTDSDATEWNTSVLEVFIAIIDESMRPSIELIRRYSSVSAVAHRLGYGGPFHIVCSSAAHHRASFRCGQCSRAGSILAPFRCIDKLMDRTDVLALLLLR